MAELDPAILNAGLDLAMEFGPNWMQPIQARLAARHPRLSTEALDAYEAACRETMTWAHLRVPEHWNAVGGDEAEAFRRFKVQVLTAYPWISGKNLKRLWTQGRYYASKDGLLE
ncbi:MAG: hypothetical protein KY467_07695 [Gemmatimonadetes bacterium]|nr:hypothetical protein [Gemmatimonadota bacterium]